mmetsp:Transcript_23139/g.64340  ORF Transcript_23139/g.64340 Transcript_23139/m.64340 type:complete len:540 (-) Transcript_23139:115-1734(-)
MEGAAPNDPVAKSETCMEANAADPLMNHMQHPTEPFQGLFDSVAAATATPGELAQKALETKKISENKHNVWMEFLAKLRAYKEAHGDCTVPRGFHSDTRLANWVCEQRKQYKLMKDGKKSNITQHRIDLLDELGFAWNAQEAAWDRHYADMKKFKAENGHCLVPETHKQFPKLYVWIKEQRRHYSLWKQGKPAHMTEKRHQLLEQIGFCWDHREAIWSTRLQQLTTYKKENGDCLVPAEYSQNPKLGRWVKQQRKEYKKFVSGKSSQITAQRIAALDDVNFCWRANKNRVDKKGENGESDSEDDPLGAKKQSLGDATTQQFNPEMDQSANGQPINGMPILAHDPHQPNEAKMLFLPNQEQPAAGVSIAQQHNLEGFTVQPQHGMVDQLQSQENNQVKEEGNAPVMDTKPSDVAIEQAATSLQDKQQQQQTAVGDPVLQDQAAEQVQAGLPLGPVEQTEGLKPLGEQEQGQMQQTANVPIGPEQPAESKPTEQSVKSEDNPNPPQPNGESSSEAAAFFAEESSQGPAKRQKLDMNDVFAV